MNSEIVSKECENHKLFIIKYTKKQTILGISTKLILVKNSNSNNHHLLILSIPLIAKELL